MRLPGKGKDNDIPSRRILCHGQADMVELAAQKVVTMGGTFHKLVEGASSELARWLRIALDIFAIHQGGKAASSKTIIQCLSLRGDVTKIVAFGYIFGVGQSQSRQLLIGLIEGQPLSLTGSVDSLEYFLF